MPVSPSTLCSPITDVPVSLSLSPARKSQSKAKTKAREVSAMIDEVQSHYQCKLNYPGKDKTRTF